MTQPAAATAATSAIDAVLEQLVDAGVPATRDAGAFYPQPVGVLVGLPTLVARGLAAATYTVPVHVVSGDPINAALAVDRLYAVADEAALALRIDQYRPGTWQPGPNAEPLQAIELAATVTVTVTPYQEVL